MVRVWAAHRCSSDTRQQIGLKIYTASEAGHAYRWKALRLAGQEITASWIDESHQSQADYSELASRCVDEIKSADFLLLYCEAGEVLKDAPIEAGIALALGKQVRSVGICDSLSRIFIRHPLWRQFNTIGEALDAE